MNHRKYLVGTAAALGMLLLILDSRTALDGAREGLELCIRTVIPSLFPFFVLSALVTGSMAGQDFGFLRPLERLLGIPRGAGPLLLTGFLGGYPIGAQGIEAALQSGQLTPVDAARMLAFCNNAGPAFLFGMAASLFPRLWMAWALWGIHILSALLVGVLLPGKSNAVMAPGADNSTSLPAAVQTSLRAMAMVCAWVVLFRVVLAFLNRWFFWLMPARVSLAITGLLELANGCCALVGLENTGLRFLYCAAFLAFGGVCVTLQTMSVARKTSLRYYFPGKLLQTVFSILLATLVLPLFPDAVAKGLPVPAAAALGALIFLLYCLKKRKKGVEICGTVVYNEANIKI